MVQLSMDGPNKNLKFLQKLKEQRNELGFPELINLGSCNLHIIHGAFKTCAEVSGYNVKSLLKSCFQLLKNLLG